MELYASFVDYAPGQAVERINLTKNGALADATKAGIAGAGAEVFHLGRDERRPGSGSRCGCACFRAGMATSYNHHIEGPTRRQMVSDQDQ